MVTGNRILVVDDSEEVRDLLADALAKQGYEVQIAANGQHAWELLQQSWFSYDLVISDVRMPAMGGIELLGRIKEDYPSIKVILMSGDPDPDLQERAWVLGACAVLPKLCDLERIHEALRLALATPAPSRPSETGTAAVHTPANPPVP